MHLVKWYGESCQVSVLWKQGTGFDWECMLGRNLPSPSWILPSWLNWMVGSIKISKLFSLYNSMINSFKMLETTRQYELEKEIPKRNTNCVWDCLYISFCAIF